MYQTALLILSGPIRIVIESIGQYLSWTNEKVAHRLYVKLEPELCKPFSKSDTISLSRLSAAVPVLYDKASFLCKNVDVRVLLGNNEHSNLIRDKKFNFDAIITNNDNHKDINNYVERNFGDSCNNVIKLDCKNIHCEELASNFYEFKTFKTVCIGGTFDRLHNGHKVLLSEAVLKASEELVVGVSVGDCLKRKTLWELIEPIEKRIEEVTNFLCEIDPSLRYEVVPITDIYGPTITKPSIECLVVTPETKIGGEKVNIERKKKGMPETELHLISLIEDKDHTQDEEEKLSSSTIRMHLLGKPLKMSKPSCKPNKPYSILLQGHPLFGKSFIASRFQVSSIPVLSCDEIFYAILKKDDNLKQQILKEFPSLCCCDDGTIEYEKLLVECLKSKEKKNWLAQLVLIKIKSALKQVFDIYSKEGTQAIIINDSSFFEGCNLGIEMDEIWAAILPIPQCTKLIEEHYKFTEEEAVELINSMPSNEQYVAAANILFCNIWSLDTTQNQVNRAYSYLKSIQTST
ncbi:bifunctional coenzyme A synthase [Nephila pilipes]|uniref:Bifunctional coenzyme A synthase n=1 Tax=Nephila pilipes TaxID=299642 RepID=A0A8X6QCP6_NEPPI|nr:bifunctional coenzyme A synthase [Nephila pilipes]